MIRVLGWNDSHRTLIEISLPIIYIYISRDLNYPLLRKVVCTLFQDSALLFTWPQPKTFYPITLSIPGVARDQVWYKRPPFYNSNFSKPNGLASPFGEVQLDETKLHFIAITPGSRSRKNVPSCSAKYDNLDELGNFVQRTLAPSNAGWSQPSQTRRPPRSARIILMPPAPRAPTAPRLLHPVCSFVLSWPKEWLPCLE